MPTMFPEKVPGLKLLTIITPQRCEKANPALRVMVIWPAPLRAPATVPAPPTKALVQAFKKTVSFEAAVFAPVFKVELVSVYLARVPVPVVWTGPVLPTLRPAG
jgi:hypothetical protein